MQRCTHVFSLVFDERCGVIIKLLWPEIVAEAPEKASAALVLIVQDMRWPALSDARVPCVAIFCPQHAGAQAFAELFEVISDRGAGDVFDVLVAELAGNAHAQRSAEWHGQLASVHTVADESLRVQPGIEPTSQPWEARTEEPLAKS
jgi:hypothetical protein